MNKYYFATEMARLINPPLHSKFFEKHKESLENVYSSCRKAPLGCTPTSNIPHNNAEMVFGVSTAKGIPAIDLMFPSKSKVFQSVYSNEFSYKKHNDAIKPAGVKLEDSDNSVEQVKELLNFSSNQHSTIIRPSSYVKKAYCNHRKNDTYDYIEGKDHVIYGNGNDCKVKESKKSLLDKHLVEVIWNLLKIKNHENFPDLVSAFEAYKNDNDKVTLLNIQKMCQIFGISVPLHLLEKLLEKCEIIDKDGVLSYEEFIHSLNWKDMLPENRNFKNIKYVNDWKEGINNPSEAITNRYRTTASFIGDHKHTASCRTAGLPSHKKDIGRSKLNGNGSSTIQPNVFAKCGIYEEDLSELLSKEEIKSVLRNSGIKFSERTFEIIWQNENNNDKASIGNIWSALKKNCLLFDQY